MPRFVARTGEVLPVVALALAAAAAFGLAWLARSNRARLADALLVLLLIPPGLRYVRFAWLPLLGALPFAIAGLAALAEPLTKRLGRTVSLSLALLGCAGSFFHATSELGKDLDVTGMDWSRQPVAAVQWLRERRPDASLFHPYNFGAYLIYARWPTRGVVIDPRAAMLYPDEYAERYYAAVSDPKAFATWCAETKCDTVMLQRGHETSAPLRRALAGDPGWRVVYDDSIAMVFVRK